MPTKFRYKIKDNSNKNKSSGLFVSALAENADNSLIYTDITDIESTLAALTIGNIVGASLLIPRTTGADVAPADVAAQNEIVLVIAYQDTVTLKKYYFTVPSPDPALRLVNTDEVDPANQVWIDAVAVFEAAQVSELDNPIVILSGSFEGRSG